MGNRLFVWVVEMHNGRRWVPCADCALTKADGLFRKREWKRRNKEDRFRIMKYEIAV